ncbi:MAG: DNA polymerase III subunit delta [Bradymonadales bacterium]|nr:DNA polymerase III subunit delta [Bradymonadales bacterium]
MSPVRDGRELFRALARGEPPAAIYLLFGEETFLVEEAIKAIVAAVLPDGVDELSYQVLDGAEVSGATVRQSLETLSLFGGRRLIHVRNIGGMSATEQEALRSYLSRPAEQTYLLMSDRSVDNRKSFFKAVSGSAHAESIEFKPLRPQELPSWVERRARAKGLSGIDSELAHLVAELTGPDLASMDGALDKLGLYFANRGGVVTRRVIEEALDDTRLRNVFELTRQLGECDLPGSMATLGQMLDRGESAIGITAMIARHFRIVWRIWEGKERGLKGHALAQHAGCHPMFMREYERDAGRFEPFRLGEVFRAIYRAERGLKSSRLRDRLLVDSLILEVCLGDQARG